MVVPEHLQIIDERIRLRGFNPGAASYNGSKYTVNFLQQRHDAAFPNGKYGPEYTNLVALFRLVVFYRDLWFDEDVADDFYDVVASDISLDMKPHPRTVRTVVNFFAKARTAYLTAGQTAAQQAKPKVESLATHLVDCWISATRDRVRSPAPRHVWNGKRREWGELVRRSPGAIVGEDMLPDLDHGEGLGRERARSPSQTRERGLSIKGASRRSIEDRVRVIRETPAADEAAPPAASQRRDSDSVDVETASFTRSWAGPGQGRRIESAVDAGGSTATTLERFLGGGSDGEGHHLPYRHNPDSSRYSSPASAGHRMAAPTKRGPPTEDSDPDPKRRRSELDQPDHERQIMTLRFHGDEISRLKKRCNDMHEKTVQLAEERDKDRTLVNDVHKMTVQLADERQKDRQFSNDIKSATGQVRVQVAGLVPRVQAIEPDVKSLARRVDKMESLHHILATKVDRLPGSRAGEGGTDGSVATATAGQQKQQSSGTTEDAAHAAHVATKMSEMEKKLDHLGQGHQDNTSIIHAVKATVDRLEKPEKSEKSEKSDSSSSPAQDQPSQTVAGMLKIADRAGTETGQEASGPGRAQDSLPGAGDNHQLDTIKADILEARNMVGPLLGHDARISRLATEMTSHALVAQQQALYLRQAMLTINQRLDTLETVNSTRANQSDDLTWAIKMVREHAKHLGEPRRDLQNNQVGPGLKSRIAALEQEQARLSAYRNTGSAEQQRDKLDRPSPLIEEMAQDWPKEKIKIHSIYEQLQQQQLQQQQQQTQQADVADSQRALHQRVDKLEALASQRSETRARSTMRHSTAKSESLAGDGSPSPQLGTPDEIKRLHGLISGMKTDLREQRFRIDMVDQKVNRKDLPHVTVAQFEELRAQIQALQQMVSSRTQDPPAGRIKAEARSRPVGGGDEPTASFSIALETIQHSVSVFGEISQEPASDGVVSISQELLDRHVSLLRNATMMLEQKGGGRRRSKVNQQQ